MSGVKVIRKELQGLGYRNEAIIPDYSFSDVLSSGLENRVVSLAAFTQTPPSYRSAAIAVLDGTNANHQDLVGLHRALCAPLALVVSEDEVSVWEVKYNTKAVHKETVCLADIPELFRDNKDSWNPEAIHRAKSIGTFNQSYQLDFVDQGLLLAVEGEIHVKLDRLINESLIASKETFDLTNSNQAQQLFRVLFRLLSAKVLKDRGHPYSNDWDEDDLITVLRKIEEYYSLDSALIDPGSNSYRAFEAAWTVIRSGISFANISSEDLAFVYENTLVTTETRKQYGTHSTPRQVAEYVVSRLVLSDFEPEDIKIYEPFAGAGVFLVSALRHLRELLPIGWSDEKRHKFLLQKLSADELDSFACEVSQLSMILADYPNHNGWKISRNDLFKPDILFERMKQHNVILCNPPFEDFNFEEREIYPISASNMSKAFIALQAALDSEPDALGFVLPRRFIQGSKFLPLRKRLEGQFSDLELVRLPDRIFQVATIETSLLIARSPRTKSKKFTSLISTTVTDKDRVSFLKTGRVSSQRKLEKGFFGTSDGNLWIPELNNVWDRLSDNPKLGESFSIHRGVEWNLPQDQAWKNEGEEGFSKGVHTSTGMRQFGSPRKVWLNTVKENLRGNSIDRPWDKPKIIMNAGRLSRGPWRLASWFTSEPLICSQQFFGIWSKENITDEEYLVASAILNSPIANAFISVHSPEKGIRISSVKDVPMPKKMPADLHHLVSRYHSLLEDESIMKSMDHELSALLIEIDAAVLNAYDLPAKIEQELLQYFQGASRPVGFNWTHWHEEFPGFGQTLNERINKTFNPTKNWVSQVFNSLPDNETQLLHEYGVK